MFTYSCTQNHIHSFLQLFTHSLIHWLTSPFIQHEHTHSFTLSFICSFIHSRVITHSLFHALTHPAPPSHPHSTLPVPSTAACREAKPLSWLVPLILMPRTFSSILTSNLLHCAGMGPGEQRLGFPLRNRCSCNYCFDFHPLKTENSFHKLLQHAERQPLSMGRPGSA